MGDLSPVSMYPVIYAAVVTWFYEAVINDLRLLSDNQDRECNNRADVNSVSCMYVAYIVRVYTDCVFSWLHAFTNALSTAVV